MYLGIDTSNYTTSVAQIDKDNNFVNEKIMLSVKTGERGLRQSEAFYQHINNLPSLINRFDLSGVEAVGVSSKPTGAADSYMPCFIAGVNVAQIIAHALDKKLYKFSHQAGHIAAALLSSGNLNLINKEFIAFHVSGGTTEALIVKPDRNNVFDAKIITSSSDLKAGQAIDRAGVKMGFDFPCGKQIEELALKCNEKINVNIPFKNGCPSLSGVENKVNKLIDDGAGREFISAFVIECIKTAVDKMTEFALSEYHLPVVYSGGVMSNSIIKEYLSTKYNCFFAQPDLSRDNAAGIAYLTKYISE